LSTDKHNVRSSVHLGRSEERFLPDQINLVICHLPSAHCPLQWMAPTFPCYTKDGTLVTYPGQSLHSLQLTLLLHSLSSIASSRRASRARPPVSFSIITRNHGKNKNKNQNPTIHDPGQFPPLTHHPRPPSCRPSQRKQKSIIGGQRSNRTFLLTSPMMMAAAEWMPQIIHLLTQATRGTHRTQD
jgi:hypothetical protein